MSEHANKEEVTLARQDLLFGIDSNSFQQEEREWYQDNLDIVIPTMIIAAGLFQFIIRKWILPVSDKITSKLESQFPSQGLLYMPEFGLFIVVIGLILLLLFNF